MRKKVYICLPDSVKPDVLNKASRYTRYALLCGTAPVVPQLFAPYMDETLKKENVIIEIGQSLLWFCDELWVFEDERYSDAAAEKVSFCESLHIPVVQIKNTKLEKILGGTST